MIITKFHENLNLPDQDVKDINQFFLENPVIPWQRMLNLFPGIRISKLFTSVNPGKITELVTKAKKADPRYVPVNFFTYCGIDCPVDVNKDELLQILLNERSVELAYIQNGLTDPPSAHTSYSLHFRQGYLNAAPEGINAKYAWGFDGGNGDGEVKFIDIEQGWISGHEAININTLFCTGINNYHFEDHGAAVLGVIMMREKEKRPTGITPCANGYIISQWRPGGLFNNADAIMAAVSQLEFGDILLLESQVYDSPASNNAWPVEIHEATFQAIRLATACGITVIEAGANGNRHTLTGNDLDLLTINQKKILNPMSIDFRDSGAIIVAAATSAWPHQRMNYSNYGKRVNCYAWGENVATAGCYPGSSGFAVNTYTQRFSGTSSAAAIIAGAAISLQSIAEANLGFRLNPSMLRTLMSNDDFNTCSVNGRAADKIGVMPDLKQIINLAFTIAPLSLNNHPGA
jgi:Subtilase family